MTDEYFIIVQYLVIELRRGNKGGKGRDVFLGGSRSGEARWQLRFTWQSGVTRDSGKVMYYV